jgi:hypothetical protein
VKLTEDGLICLKLKKFEGGGVGMNAMERAVIHWKAMTKSVIDDGRRILLVGEFQELFGFDPDDFDVVKGVAYAAVRVPEGLIQFELSICSPDECQGKPEWRWNFDSDAIVWLKCYRRECNNEEVGVKAKVIVPLACVKPPQQ